MQLEVSDGEKMVSLKKCGVYACILKFQQI